MFDRNNTNPEPKDNVDSSASNSSSLSGSSSGSNINFRFQGDIPEKEKVLLNNLGLSIASGHIVTGKIFWAKFNDNISDKELIENDFAVKVLIKEERKALERLSKKIWKRKNVYKNTDSPNIIKYYDVRECKTRFYIVME